MYKYSDYDALIFDLGNTILPIAPQLTVEAFYQLEFKEDVLNPSEEVQIILDDYQKGLIPSRDFLLSLQRQFPEKVEIESISRAWSAMLLDFPMAHLKLLKKLKKTHEILLLSNTNALHQVFFEKKAEKGGYPLGELFDKIFYSHILGKSKPDAEIYEYVHENAGLTGKRVLFLDDLAENLIEPKRLEWDAVQISEGNTILDFQ